MRAAYVAGMTALECHQRFGPKVATIRRRVDNEGWRRDPLPARPTFDEPWDEKGAAGSEFAAGVGQPGVQGRIKCVSTRRTLVGQVGARPFQEV